MTEQIAIVYATKEGQTRRIADHVGERLAGAEFEPVEFEAKSALKNFDMNDYGGAILGASIHAGSFPKVIGRLVGQHRTALQQLPTAFYSVSLVASLEDEESRATSRRLLDEFCEDHRWQPTMTESFAGAIPFSEYGFIKRTIMKFILKRNVDEEVDTSRDYEYTNWDRVDAFVDEYERRYRDMKGGEERVAGR